MRTHEISFDVNDAVHCAGHGWHLYVLGLRLFRVCSSFLCVRDIRDYHKLPALMWFTSLEYRAQPTERVLTDSPFHRSSRACLGFCDRLSSACPVSL